jgi:hypothetical protein
LASALLDKYEEVYLYKNRRPNLSKNIWKVIIDHINGIFGDVFFTKRQVKTNVDTLRKRYKIYKEKKSQSGTRTSEAISWPHYDVADRLWAITPKTSGILGGMDAGQLSRPVVVGTTIRPSNVDDSQTSIQVPDLNFGMEPEEHEKMEGIAEGTEGPVQGIGGAGTSAEAVGRATETHEASSRGPLTMSHKVDANITGQRTSHKRKESELDYKTQYMAGAFTRRKPELE